MWNTPPPLPLLSAGGEHTPLPLPLSHRYTKHLDRNEWESANRREITILCYVNCAWDAAADGGCLRIHPSGIDGQAQPLPREPLDVSPIGGRLVLFRSASVFHEVLPCARGERLALTLWVEFAE